LRKPLGLPAMADRMSQCYDSPMAGFLSKLVLPIAVGAVAFVLLLGLINMMRGGSPNRSQKLMQWRVLLQFIAIVLTMLTVWVMGHN
jgi:uncharacterized membrane-anchored protein